MAIEDYYRTIYFVDRARRPDETGGFEYVYQIGESIQASCVRASNQEQIVAGVRGNLGEQYNLTLKKNIPVSKDDVFMFYDEDNRKIFLRVNSPSLYTPKQSKQAEWKGFTATEFEPDLRVVE